MRAVDGRLVAVPVIEAKALPKKQKCHYCKDRATKRIIHSEGMAYIPTCLQHLAAGKADAAKCTPSGTSDPSNIVRVDDIAQVKALPGQEASGGGTGPTGPLQPPTDTQPRDRMGKTVEVGGTVALGSGGQGTVLSNEGGGRVRVRKSDGTEVVVDASQTTLIRGATANAQHATGPDGLQAALEADPDATPPPGDRPDAAAETDTEAAVGRPVGAEPAPDADPAGALAVLATADGSQMAWLRTDESDDGSPVGYLRPIATDPSTTLRFSDGQAWAAAVDAEGMAAVNDVPTGPNAPTPGGMAADPTLPPLGGPPVGMGQQTPDGPADPSLLPAAAAAPTTAEPTQTTATQEQLRIFLLDGLDNAPDAVAHAKAEAVAGIATRMADVEDDDILRQEDADRLARISGGQVVLLRVPRPGVVPSPAPTPGEQLTQWIYREIDTARFQSLVDSRQPPPANLEVVTAEQWRAWCRSARIADALALWAAGSGGTNPDALALQETAADLFGMTSYAPAPQVDEIDGLRQQVEDALAADRKFYEALLIAMYQSTQDRFAAQQVHDVELYRGWRTPAGVPEWAVDDVTEDLPLRPLSSWSSERQLAGGYARGATGTELGYLTTTTVPVERILGTPRTGFGSLVAEEFVILAGPTQAAVHEATEADGAALPISWAPTDVGGADAGDPAAIDAANIPVGLIASEEQLTAAIAAAETPERRLELMARAQTMGLGEQIPEDWQANGLTRPVDGSDAAVRGADGRLVPLDDQQFAAHTAAVEDAVSRALAAGLQTTSESLDGDGEVWPADRAATHVEIVDAVWATAANVPDDGKALLIAGLPGAHLADTLANPSAGVDITQYLTISLSDVKEIMAARELVPAVPDAGVELSPAERTPLLHDEAVAVANLIATRAYTEHKNIAWDLGLTDEGTAETMTASLREAGYGEVVGIFVDVPIPTSVARATEAYRRALEDYRNGEGLGGRYVPEATITDLASPEFTSAPRVHFEEARDGFDDFQVWDDSVDGRTPELVYYKDAPNLDALTEAARTGTMLQAKALPGTRAALLAMLRRKGGLR